MRAPSKAELESGADRLYGDGTGKPVPESSESIFYAEADLQLAEAEPGRISASSIQRLRSQELLDRDFSDEQLVTVLGSVVTNTKAWLTPDSPTEKEVAAIVSRFAGKSNLTVHGMARIAYSDLAGIRLLFANGFVKELGQQDLDLVRELCSTRKVCMLTSGQHNDSTELIEWLATKGVFDHDME